MGYYSSRKPYYDLTKSQVEFFAGSSRFLKQSLVKESVMEKPYLEDEYQQMHLNIPPPIWPDPYPPWGPFGPIYGYHYFFFPPPSCGIITATGLPGGEPGCHPGFGGTIGYGFGLDCGDVSILTFRANSFFEESWSWTWQFSSADFPPEDIYVQYLLGGDSIALSTNVRDTSGTIVVCGIGTAGLIPLIWRVPWELGTPAPMLPQFTYEEVATQLGIVRCCEEVLFNCLPCIPDPAMAWDYETSGETIGQDDSCVVAVTGLNQPFTWSVSGTGFTLAHTETTTNSTFLLADASSCGTATITVTGCDGVTVIGYVRGAVGQWVLKSNTCGLGGAGEVTVTGLNFEVELITDNAKQYDYYTYHETYRDEEDDTDCANSISIACVGSQDCLTFTLPCAEMWGAGAYDCSPVVCFESCGKIPYTEIWRLWYVYYTVNYYYYEWEC